MICVSAETKTWMKRSNKPRIKTVRDGENMNIEERLNVKSKPPRTATLRLRRHLDWQVFQLVEIQDLGNRE